MTPWKGMPRASSTDSRRSKRTIGRRRQIAITVAMAITVSTQVSIRLPNSITP